MSDISQIKLPDGTSYNLKDSYVRTNYRALNNNDFDTINVTELNAGNVIVTGVGRFTNGLYGNLTGNADTATLATTATKLSNTTKVGDTNNPVYFTANGVPAAISYTISKSVPSDAVFTDTTYTLGTNSNNVTLTPSSGTVQSITVPYATSAASANQLNEDVSYINSGTAFVVHTTNKIFKTYLSRFNNVGIDSSNSAGCLVLAGSWSSSSYTAELALGMGDSYGVYYRGKNSGTEQDWQAIGRFTTTPTTGEVMITDGVKGGMKSSGYTIAKSVPSDAVFTDTKNTAGSTNTSSKIYLVGATSQAANPQTYSDDEVYTTSGVLTTKSVQVGGGSATIQYNSTTNSLDFVFAN